MTVAELRQLLFDIEDQNAQVHFLTEQKYGVVTGTKTITGVGHPTDPKGHVTLTSN